MLFLGSCPFLHTALCVTENLAANVREWDGPAALRPASEQTCGAIQQEGAHAMPRTCNAAVVQFGHIAIGLPGIAPRPVKRSPNETALAASAANPTAPIVKALGSVPCAACQTRLRSPTGRTSPRPARHEPSRYMDHQPKRQ